MMSGGTLRASNAASTAAARCSETRRLTAAVPIEPGWTRRDYRLLGGGIGLGAALVLALEAILWLLIRGRG